MLDPRNVVRRCQLLVDLYLAYGYALEAAWEATVIDLWGVRVFARLYGRGALTE